MRGNNMRKVTIGFDIGVSSVGWSVVDMNNGAIVETGVRLFSASSAENNVERRNNRQTRRLNRRRKNRLKDVKYLLETNHFTFDQEQGTNPYELRVAGLHRKLTRSELARALYHLVKRRGISYDLTDIEEEEIVTTSAYKTALGKNQSQLAEKTPGEIQFARLENYGKVRGSIEINEQDILLNIFPTSAYLNEAKRILATQRKFYPEITEAFIEKYCTILTRKREYYVGPGTEKNRTDYGIYRTNGETLDNLFEILIGKDKFYPNEERAAGNSYTAQLFNFVNDLNNLKIQTIEDQKLTPKQKEEIIEQVKTAEKKVSLIQLISKITKTPKDQITGYRTDKNGKPDLHSMAVFRKVRKQFLTMEIDILHWPDELLNDLGRLLTLNTEKGEIRKQLTKDFMKRYPILNEQLVDQIIENRHIFAVSGNHKWHRFSLRTMNELLPEMLATSKEQMTLLSERGMIKQHKRDYLKMNELDARLISEEIYNPVVGKSVREAIKLFNELMKKYQEVRYVVLEMPRDDNEEKAKKELQKYQKENENEKEIALSEFQRKGFFSDAQLERALIKDRKLKTKIRFWHQQEGKCLYSGQIITPVELLTNSFSFDIDHIIPQSVSFDDSLNNKVLCTKEMNDQKGKQTPYGFLLNGNGQGFDRFKAMVNANRLMSKGKKKNLLFMEDLNNIETRKRFIARNLVDTRYASRVVLNEIQQYLRAKNKDTQVAVVRGKFTATLRKHWNINKSRETHHHHALDASIIAITPLLSVWKKKQTLIPKTLSEEKLEFEYDDIVEDTIFEKALYQLPKENFKEQLNNSQPNIKFSYQVDKKMNRKVSDATIYSVKQAKLSSDKQSEEYVLAKIKDIYSVEGYKTFAKIYEKDKSKFLMAQNDPKTFEKLEEIIQSYPSTREIIVGEKVKVVDVSPFELYRKEYGYITKYAKKNNGPIIRQLKYYDHKIGMHLDITNQKNNGKGKKVILQQLKSWRTDVYYNHEKQEYEIMGLKYSDLRFKKDQYGIPKERYQEVKQMEKIAPQSEFCFSLYRNDRIKVLNKETDEEVELLFGARNYTSAGYVDLKPIDRVEFGKKEWIPVYQYATSDGKCKKKFAKKGYEIYKVNTTILGESYYIKKERMLPKNILD